MKVFYKSREIPNVCIIKWCVCFLVISLGGFVVREPASIMRCEIAFDKAQKLFLLRGPRTHSALLTLLKVTFVYSWRFLKIQFSLLNIKTMHSLDTKQWRQAR